MKTATLPSPAAALAPPMAALKLLSDERLARWAANGSQPAFAVIYERHHQALHRYCQSLLGNGHDAGDALQNTMLKALRSLPGETREIALKPWLYRIAHNESISLLRARRGHSDLDSAAHLGGAAADTIAESRERLRDLTADLRELTDQQRGTLLMRELAGMQFDEISAALQLSATAAKQSVYEARCALQSLQEGRAMDCDVVRRTLSDGDRRTLRNLKLRGHLRACAQVSATSRSRCAIVRRTLPRSRLRCRSPRPRRCCRVCSAPAPEPVTAAAGCWPHSAPAPRASAARHWPPRSRPSRSSPAAPAAARCTSHPTNQRSSLNPGLRSPAAPAAPRADATPAARAQLQTRRRQRATRASSSSSLQLQDSAATSADSPSAATQTPRPRVDAAPSPPTAARPALPAANAAPAGDQEAVPGVAADATAGRPPASGATPAAAAYAPPARPAAGAGPEAAPVTTPPAAQSAGTPTTPAAGVAPASDITDAVIPPRPR